MSSAVARRLVVGLLGVSFAVALPATAQAKPASSYLAGDQILVNHYAEIESEKLGGLTLPGGAAQFITVRESSLHTLPEQGPDGAIFQGAADTVCADAQGHEVGPATHCTITVAVAPHVSDSRGKPTKNLAVIDPEIRSTIAHEVFHCYQVVMAGTLANFRRPEATWLIEGSATWVESDLVPDDTGAREEWAIYLKSPEEPLLERTYTAIGFFAHLASSGISPWSRFPAMFAATSNTAAYNVSVSRSAAFLDSEASAFFREPAFGSAWDAQGPNVPTRAEVDFKPHKEDITASKELSVAAYADGVYHLSLKQLPAGKPVLELQVSKGWVRLHATAGGDVDEVDPTELKLCSDSKGCDCPGQPSSNYPQFKQGDLAITGGQTGGKVQLTPRKRCEELLPARSCEGLLPEFTVPVAKTLENATHEPLAYESGTGGEHTSLCLFPGAKGEEIQNADDEAVFDGVFALQAYVKRYPSIAQAKQSFALPAALPGGATPSRVSGIGDEAGLETVAATNAKGEPEYISEAIVRVSNVVAGFSIGSSGGNTEADGTGAQALLSQVAGEL